jgi:hypothetical protein
MRKPVSVKSDIRSVLPCRSGPPLPPSLPSALLGERCSLGASWAFSFQSVLPPDFRLRLRLSNGGLGQRLSQSPELGGRNSAIRILDLCRCGQHALIAERFVALIAHLQSMKQDGQLPRHCHHRSFLRILASALGQSQTPASQITVGSEETKNVVRALHHHCS